MTRVLLDAFLLAATVAGATDEPALVEETPYVISPSVVVDTMLAMAKVTEKDFLIDLGSGMINFYERDIFKADFGEATVVTMYLLPEYNLLLKPKLLALKPGTRVVSME